MSENLVRKRGEIIRNTTHISKKKNQKCSSPKHCDPPLPKATFESRPSNSRHGNPVSGYADEKEPSKCFVVSDYIINVTDWQIVFASCTGPWTCKYCSWLMVKKYCFISVKGMSKRSHLLESKIWRIIGRLEGQTQAIAVESMICHKV
ncbi:hypothetical protein TNCV_1102681 [Trichonephila clavipes]|nr:hypothetical protein TNCV_1102681 [Trichonephila clavipes]